MTRALIVVDMQNDFCEGGSLAVEGGNEVAYRIANCIREYKTGGSLRYQYMVGTKDWHKPSDSNGGHISDNPNYQTTWPAHCIQGTEGAMFHPAIAELSILHFDAVFYKGDGRPDYSGFQGKTPTMYGGYTYLLEWLQERRVDELDIVGLATDHCVRATALDGIQNGFKVRIPQALTAAVGGPEQRDLMIRTIQAAQGLDGTLIN